MTTWAPLVKSPNCASQMTRASGSAVLEPEHRLLGEQRVDYAKARLTVVEVLQRSPRSLLDLVVQHRVPVEEGAALAVLAGQAHRVALAQQRRVREVLGEAPVEGPLAARHLEARIDDALHAAMQLEAFGNLAHLRAERLDGFDRHAGVGRVAPVRVKIGIPVREIVDPR